MAEKPFVTTTQQIVKDLSGLPNAEALASIFDEVLARPTPRGAFVDFIMAQTQLNIKIAAAVVSMASDDQKSKVDRTGEMLALLSNVNDLAMTMFNKLSREGLASTEGDASL